MSGISTHRLVICVVSAAIVEKTNYDIESTINSAAIVEKTDYKIESTVNSANIVEKTDYKIESTVNSAAIVEKTDYDIESTINSAANLGISLIRGDLSSNTKLNQKRAISAHGEYRVEKVA